jgi:hypothetical protein
MSLRLGDIAPNFKASTTEFPKGVKLVKPYLRYTPQPDL